MGRQVSGVDEVSVFLLELRSEEIPARMQAGARAELEKLFRAQLAAAGVALSDLTLWSTPRRLTLVARGLPAATEAVSEEAKGPRTSAPEQALEGFLRKTGLSKDQLTERDGVWYAITEKPGRAVAEVLAEAIPAIVRGFSWPKSMRWGVQSLAPESLRWVRPLSGIVALLDGAVVPCEVGGIAAGRETVGHRFHSSGSISIDSAESYAAQLRTAHVIVEHEERAALVRAGAAKAAADAGLALVEDEGLVVENAGLTEWPVPLLGRFDEAFLEVPPEVIQLTARVNQKYFICRDKAGKLANAFICTANIVPSDGGAGVVGGNRKVLAARLSDARFFWQQDRKVALADQAKKLERITFHEKLGTVADKVARVAKLAEWLAAEGIVPNCDPALARQAAELCKADLVTEMVGEFPELQGLMGGYYARAEGLPDAVADAIRDHYKPVGQGDGVPTAPVTVAVALADKLDTFLAFFDIKEYPTGSKDPFALRRAALAIIRLIFENSIKVHTDAIVQQWLGQADPNKQLSDRDLERRSLIETALDFLLDRLAVQQRDAGIRHDFVTASRRSDGRDDGRLDLVASRASALQAFVGTADGANLLAGYKRAANILKAEVKAGWAEGATNPAPEPAEAALIAALDAAGPRAEAAVAAEDFAGAMAALATLRAPIDAFFEDVTVNHAEPAIRAARLQLLARFRDAVHQVADFSRIEG